MENNQLNLLVKELCEEKNIKLNILSYGWVLQLIKGHQQKYIIDDRFGLNPDTSDRIAVDKYATYESLKALDIPVIEHTLLLNHLTRSNYMNKLGLFNEVCEYYRKQKSGKLVIKSNTGQSGIGVYLCNNMLQVEKSINLLFKTNNSIVMCPYYNIKTEYRTIYLDNECLLVYGKHKSNNSWKHNLSHGAIPEILNKGDLYDKICLLVKKIATALNIRFASIDIILTEDNEMYLIEVNSGVAMTKFIQNIENGRNIAKNIYGQAIDKMFL